MLWVDATLNGEMLYFLKIWLYYLGSLYERIKSTTKCIRFKRCTRHKDFHRGNHKWENSTNFFRIVRWSKYCLSLSCALESVYGVYKWGRAPPYLYPLKSLSKYKTQAYMSSRMGPTSPRETTITYYMIFALGTIFPTFNRGFTSRYRHNLYIS